METEEQPKTAQRGTSQGTPRNAKEALDALKAALEECRKMNLTLIEIGADGAVSDLVAALDHVPACALKMHKGEPAFTLRGQDEMAPLTVEFWARANAILHNLMKSPEGLSADEAFEVVADRLVAHFRDYDDADLTPKLKNAFELIPVLADWQPRKLAD